MLHNLLPRETKKNLRNEYVVRMLGIALFLVATTVIIGAVSLLPTYISISSSLDAISANEVQDENKPDNVPMKELTHTAVLLENLNEKLAAEPMTELVNNIIAVHPEGIRLTGIIFERTPLSFSLRGVATNREALVAYKRALEGLSRVTSVSSPIADLAKSTNLEFTLAVQLSEKENS